MKGWPSRSDSHWAIKRPRMSGELPGAMPMISRTGFVGYDCAHVRSDTTGRAAAPAAKRRNRRRGSFVLIKSPHIAIGVAIQLDGKLHNRCDIAIPDRE